MLLTHWQGCLFTPLGDKGGGSSSLQNRGSRVWVSSPEGGSLGAAKPGKKDWAEMYVLIDLFANKAESQEGVSLDFLHGVNCVGTADWERHLLSNTCLQTLWSTLSTSLAVSVSFEQRIYRCAQKNKWPKTTYGKIIVNSSVVITESETNAKGF